MASACSVPPKDQFLCSVCLEMFSQPVTLPCGHNFCKVCITGYWDSCFDTNYSCPLCMETFHHSVKDTLQVNTMLREVIDSVKAEERVNRETSAPVTRESSAPVTRETSAPETREVVCDVCTGTKNHVAEKAVKSCWQCLVSFCPVHLQPHHQVPGLQRHSLVEPIHSLEEKVCLLHNTLLDHYCHTHTACVCPRCLATGHGPACAVVTLETECEDRRAVQEAGEAEIRKVIGKGTRELLYFKEELEEHLGRVNTRFTYDQMNSDPTMKAHSTAMFTLRRWVEQSTRTLQQEASEGKMRVNELKKLWNSKDYYLLLKSFLNDNRRSSVTGRVEGIRRALDEQRETFSRELNVFGEHEERLRKMKEQQRFLVTAFLCFVFLFLGLISANGKPAS